MSRHPYTYCMDFGPLYIGTWVMFRVCSVQLHCRSDKIVLASCGFHGDVLKVTSAVKERMKMYEYEHHRKMRFKKSLMCILTVSLVKRA